MNDMKKKMRVLHYTLLFHSLSVKVNSILGTMDILFLIFTTGSMQWLTAEITHNLLKNEFILQ